MGDISIKGRSPLLKGGRVGFGTGKKVLGVPPKKVGAIARLTGDTGGVKEVFPGMGITGGASRGAKATGPIKSQGKIIGTRIAKAGSLKAMGIPRPRSKSEAKFQNFKKRIEKTPDKVFKSENISGKAQKKKIIQQERTILNKQKRKPSDKMAKGGRI